MALLEVVKHTKYILKINWKKSINPNMGILGCGLMDIILNNIKLYYLMNLLDK